MTDTRSDDDVRINERYQAPRKGMRFCFAEANKTGTALSVVWGHFFFTNSRTHRWIVVDGDASQMEHELNQFVRRDRGPGKTREVVVDGRSRIVTPSYTGGRYVLDVNVLETLTHAERDVILDPKYQADEALRVITHERNLAEEENRHRREEEIRIDLAKRSGK